MSKAAKGTSADERDKGPDPEAYMVFRDLMQSVCRQRNRISQLVDLEARLSGSDPSNLRQKYYLYRSGERLPSVDSAWFIGEALHSFGERWMSGLITLFAAGYLAEFTQMFNLIRYDFEPDRLSLMLFSLPMALTPDPVDEPLNFATSSKATMSSDRSHIAEAFYQKSRDLWYRSYDITFDPSPDRAQSRTLWVLPAELHQYIDSESVVLDSGLNPTARFDHNSIMMAYQVATDLKAPYKTRAAHVLAQLDRFTRELAEDDQPIDDRTPSRSAISDMPFPTAAPSSSPLV